MTDWELIEHMHARGWNVGTIDVPMIREACKALAVDGSPPFMDAIAILRGRGMWAAVDALNDALASPPPVTAAREKEASATGAEPAEAILRDLTQLASEMSDHTPQSFNAGIVRLANRAHKVLATPTTSTTGKVDVEQMLRDCVPGGSSCDPQTIADDIRGWFAGSTKSEGEA